jgi:UDP-galactopyranose mutase
MSLKILVVGAGFAGSVCAERLAARGHFVDIIERRDHIAGNAYDEYDAHGVLVHKYGPHIFHTNSRQIFAYLSKFTNWRFYEHRSRALVDGKYYPIPINRTTVNALYGLNLTPEEVAAYFEKVRIARTPILTSEDVVLNSVGKDLCDKFFRGYTKKQWGLDLSELSASVAARIPTRTDDDDRYFSDTFQFMPVDGYTPLFQRMLDHPNIKVSVNTEFSGIASAASYDHVVYSGPIDAFYDYRYGALPYRGLRFEHEHIPDRDTFQDVATVNFPNDFDYTRITEFRHLTGQQHKGTSIVREYPLSDCEPYYPVPRKENEALFKQYEALASKEERVTFVGRLAQYRYYNMDQVVGAALTAAAKIV